MARCHALEQEFFRNLLSYVSRVANGENQSENLRRALLSELGLMQGAA